MHPCKSLLFALVVCTSLACIMFLLPDTKVIGCLHEQIPTEMMLSSCASHEDATETESSDVIQPDTVSFPIESQSAPDSLDDGLMPWTSVLDSLSSGNGQTRIMYYGDSQIEGDRLTSYLREYLRGYMGGTGPGLFLPVMTVMYTNSIYIQSSSNWERYNYLSYTDGLISNKSMGPFMSLCRYLPEAEVSDYPVRAVVKVRPSNVAGKTASYFERLRLFYGNCSDDVVLKVSSGNALFLVDTLKRDEGVNELSCLIDGASQVTLEFVGRVSPDVYGISIESDSGLIIDNIPQRGSAGLEFTMVDETNLKESFDLLKPDLVVIQYGLNVVKNVRKEYGYYKKGVSRQIDRLKRVSDNVPVLVVGVTDMTNDTESLYTNIPAIVDAQKGAANESGAYFWDAYVAMGGQGSIFEWQKKHLAQIDGAHLTPSGVDTLAKLLIDDLFVIDTSKTIVEDVVQNNDTISCAVDSVANDVEQIVTSMPNIWKYLFAYNEDNPLIFTSVSFWIFFCVTLLFFTFVYKREKLRNIYLLLVSLFFYYKTGGMFVALLIGVIVVNYLCGLAIGQSKSKGKRGTAFLLIGVVTNLSILLYFKYAHFLVDMVNEAFGTSYVAYDWLASFANVFMGGHFDVDAILLPVGISFFLFQALSYIIDVRRGDVVPVRNLADFGFYISFFPQLVAGPIVRASEFMSQMSSPYKLTVREYGHALFLVCKGLVKKIAIADFVAVLLVDKVFEAPMSFSGFENLMAIYGYALQIYCDFSGYTDIAIGLALVFGFRLPLNFNSPYKATSLTDFWRRWHISLSRWLKDYLYIPLGGNRKGTFRTGLNLMITMLLGGLWHGASIRFVVWGGLHGVGLIIDKLIAPIRKKVVKYRFAKIVSVFLTFNFVAFCWVFFRAENLNMAMTMIGQVFRSFSPGSYLNVLMAYGPFFLLLFAGYLIHFIPENAKEWSRGLFISMPVVCKVVVVVLIAILLCAAQSTTPMPFIYFRF